MTAIRSARNALIAAAASSILLALVPVTARQQPRIEARSKRVISVEGLRFKDANGNGTLEPYEDIDVFADWGIRYRIGMVVLVVSSISKVVRRFVVDLRHDDGAVRIDPWLEHFGDGVVPSTDLSVIARAGVARDGEHSRRETKHHWIVLG